MRSSSRGLALQTTLLCVMSLLGTAAVAQGPVGAITVFDTRSPSEQRLTRDDWAKHDAWQQVARNQKMAEFQGDAVISNGRILAAFRQQAAAVDVYSLEAGQPVWRAQLQLQTPAGEAAARFERAALVENTRSAARLEAVYQTAKGQSIAATFRLKRGAVALETTPGDGAGLLRVEAPGRYVVLPDFFADDILIDAAQIPVAAAEMPSENFLLHLTGDGDAIAMCVFENGDQDVKVTFAEEGERRTATGSEIRFGEGGKVWLALLTGPGVWHAFDVKDEDAD